MFQFLAGLLAFFYSLIPNYAIAIALLTLTVMLVLSPLTLKSTRSMLAMQKLQPEMKALQAKHKGGDRQKLNEEMMALYKEHSVNPVAGCLPMLLQMPVFLVMYNVIRGLNHKTGESVTPKYLDQDSDLYQALVRSGGRMKSFGVDLAQSASDGHSSFGRALPFFIIVALVVFTQYIQTRQTMSRNTKAASPQQQILLKVMPGIFGVISLSIPAAVNVYFLVSALFRIGQTAAMYRFDPALAAHARKHANEIEAKATEVKPKAGPRSGATDGKAGGGSKAGGTPQKGAGNGTKPGSNRAGQAKSGGNGRRPPPRPPQKRRSKKGR
jgi:YidC/Oxa1 family membrane protein insertase